MKYKNNIDDLLDNGEEYKPVSGLNNVYATNFGRIIYSRGVSTITYYITPGKLVKGKTNKYYRIILNKREYAVNRLVYNAWKDPRFNVQGNKGSKRVVCDHIDNDSTNNRPDNLQVISQSENIKKAANIHNGTGYIKYKPCIAYNIKTKIYRNYNCTGDLVSDIWPNTKHNNGLFNGAYKNKSLVDKQWLVGYTKDDIDIALAAARKRSIYKDLKF